MRHLLLAIPAALALLAACTTPYNSPVIVKDSPPFPGIAAVMAQDKSRPVDVFVVHGMCPHDEAWALATMDNIVKSIDSNYSAKPVTAPAAAANQIQVVQRTDKVGGGTVRFHGLVWTPLVAALKQQLAYDMTGTPTDCAKDGECKPVRAHYNGKLKDTLLNSCLADALIYQGASRISIQKAVVDTLTRVLEDSEKSAGGDPGPLIVVVESLGSKIVFDALSSMLQQQGSSQQQQLARRAARRMALVFMIGNQLPILGLAEQDIGTQAQFPPDSLQRFLALRRQDAQVPNNETLSKLAVVAFTDPNDVLSYRLLPTRYNAPDVAVADVLVSNSPTWLGMVENPFEAHLGYLKNRDIGGILACGWPRSTMCR